MLKSMQVGCAWARDKVIDLTLVLTTRKQPPYCYSRHGGSLPKGPHRQRMRLPPQGRASSLSPYWDAKRGMLWIGATRGPSWGKWANFVAFPLPVVETIYGEGFIWARHGHSERFRYKTRVPSLTGWARPVFEQGALPVLASLPASLPTLFLIGVLPGDLMFQSDTLDEKYMRPAIFHGFSGCKTRWASRLKALAAKGMVTLMETLLGTPAFPPLWQSTQGCKFAVGSAWQAQASSGILTETQIQAVRGVWCRDLFKEKDDSLWASQAYEHGTMQFAAHMQPREGQPPEWSVQLSTLSNAAVQLDQQLRWAMCTEQQSIRVWCTGLGGGDPPGKL